MAENTEALKRNWFFRGFYKKKTWLLRYRQFNNWRLFDHEEGSSGETSLGFRTKSCLKNQAIKKC